MKKMKVGMLALSALAGGILAASAAVETFTPYQLYVNYTNETAKVWDVYGAPIVYGGSAYTESSVYVSTDSAGKIAGSGFWAIYKSETNRWPVTGYTVEVKGTIATKGKSTTPTVTMQIKGTGGTADGTGKETATVSKLSLKFTGEPGVNPVNTNDTTAIVGKVSGTIQGDSSLGSKKVNLKDVPAYIANAGWDYADVGVGVLQNSKKMLIFGDSTTGNGTVKSGNFKVKGKGIGWEKGISWQLDGALGPYTNTVGTNEMVFQAPKTANLKGKGQGQNVTGTASSINAWLLAD